MHSQLTLGFYNTRLKTPPIFTTLPIFTTKNVTTAWLLHGPQNCSLTGPDALYRGLCHFKSKNTPPIYCVQNPQDASRSLSRSHDHLQKGTLLK